jgi:hypothetical protein
MNVKIAATLQNYTSALLAMKIGPVSVGAVSVGATASKSLIETLYL